ncbi:DUF456 domain-containing protein [Phytohabitans houttuyneae]|uniref:DUF456 domain-containing protein n=1 Tax=Phytohabitans houttuyneae TaxID=1076126 RepID=A0A6V8KV78_9ACTN|nr:DUF456 domain-containing protein [Phytohabitans houttuyneae]GFJ86301.1 hypothetical protein Phou_104810 [Phytohabitans houttuyneae]
MELTDTNSTVTLLCGLAIAAGIVGVVVPVLPGLLLCWLGVLAWALLSDAGWPKWLVLAVATGLAAGGTAVKYLWPGRNLKRSGVPNRTLLVGGVLGLVGFFVVPIVGLVLGFVLGVWLAERVRLGDHRQAWPSTVHALKAAGLSMLIELAAALAIAAAWGGGLLVT